LFLPALKPKEEFLVPLVLPKPASVPKKELLLAVLAFPASLPKNELLAPETFASPSPWP